MQQPNIPVYLFTGFLEGGKTHIIQESMCDERFNTGEKTLIILCEEGIEELDVSEFYGKNVYLATIDAESELTAEKLEECRIIMEPFSAKMADTESMVSSVHTGLWHSVQ